MNEEVRERVNELIFDLCNIATDLNQLENISELIDSIANLIKALKESKND